MATSPRPFSDQLETCQTNDRLVYAFGLAASALASARPDDDTHAFDEALRVVGESVNADRSYLFQFHADGTLVSNTHEWCAEGIEPAIQILQSLPISSFEWSMERFRAGQVIDIPSVADLPDEASVEREILLEQSIQSLVLVPVGKGERLRGFIGFDAVRTMRPWTDDEARLLIVLGRVFEATLGRLRAERDSAQDRARLDESQRKFGQLLDVIDDTVVLHDAQGRILDVNRAGLRRLGYTREQSTNLTVAMMEVGASPDQLLHTWEMMLPGDATRINGIHRRSDGLEFPVNVSLACFQNCDGEKLFVAAVRDMSEENRLTDEIRQTRARLRELVVREAVLQSRTRRELAKRLHDRIGQELYLARLMLQNGLKSDEKHLRICPAQRDELVSVLTNAINESREVMRDLCDPAAEELGLEAGLRSLAARVFAHSKINFQLEIKDLSPDALDRAIVQHLLDICRELMVNVLKHACADQCKVRVCRIHCDGRIRVLVEDNGLGMPPDTTEPNHPHGLGTLFVRERIELLGGTVQWTQHPQHGSGTLVRITLPPSADQGSYSEQS